MPSTQFGTDARNAMYMLAKDPPKMDEGLETRLLQELRVKLGPHADAERLLYHIRITRGKLHWTVNSYFRDVMVGGTSPGVPYDFQPKRQRTGMAAGPGSMGLNLGAGHSESTQAALASQQQQQQQQQHTAACDQVECDSSSSSRGHLGALPMGVLEDVLAHCRHPGTLCAAACTSRAMREAAHSDVVWEQLFVARWGRTHFPLEPATAAATPATAAPPTTAAAASAPSTALLTSFTLCSPSAAPATAAPPTTAAAASAPSTASSTTSTLCTPSAAPATSPQAAAAALSAPSTAFSTTLTSAATTSSPSHEATPAPASSPSSTPQAAAATTAEAESAAVATTAAGAAVTATSVGNTAIAAHDSATAGAPPWTADTSAATTNPQPCCKSPAPPLLTHHHDGSHAPNLGPSPPHLPLQIDHTQHSHPQTSHTPAAPSMEASKPSNTCTPANAPCCSCDTCTCAPVQLHRRSPSQPEHTQAAAQTCMPPPPPKPAQEAAHTSMPPPPPKPAKDSACSRSCCSPLPGTSSTPAVKSAHSSRCQCGTAPHTAEQAVHSRPASSSMPARESAVHCAPVSALTPPPASAACTQPETGEPVCAITASEAATRAAGTAHRQSKSEASICATTAPDCATATSGAAHCSAEAACRGHEGGNGSGQRSAAQPPTQWCHTTNKGRGGHRPHIPWIQLYKQQASFATHSCCPLCGAGRVVPIVYGYPSSQLLQGMRRLQLILGGDHLIEDCHCWACCCCNASFRSYPYENPTLWMKDMALQRSQSAANQSMNQNGAQLPAYTYEL